MPKNPQSHFFYFVNLHANKNINDVKINKTILEKPSKGNFENKQAQKTTSNLKS